MKIGTNISINWGYIVYFDTDTNSATGFKGASSEFPIGADYMIQGYDVYSYSGSGTDWSWSHAGGAGRIWNNNTGEMFLPRTWLANSQKIHLFFHGNNAPYEGTEQDYYPDNAITSGNNRYFTYNVVGDVPTPGVSNKVTDGGINLDGEIADWQNLTSFGDDPDDVPASGPHVDWRKVTMAHDSNNIYLAYENDSNISVNWGYIVYLDTDANSTTGFKGAAAEYPVGAEYMIQGYWVYKYTGAGTDWSWSHVGDAGRIWNNNLGELFLPRTWLGSPQRIKMFFHGNNAPYGGTEQDYYPDNALSTGDSFLYLLN
jgi:hypothetical protein